MIEKHHLNINNSVQLTNEDTNRTKTAADTQDLKQISILDINLKVSTQGISYEDIINSPRTLEAMDVLGIQPNELDDVAYEVIKQQLLVRERKQTVPQIIVDLRYDNFQKKRENKLQLITEERDKIIFDEEQKQINYDSSIINPLFTSSNGANMSASGSNRAGSHDNHFTPARTSRSKFMDQKSQKSQMRNTMQFGSGISGANGFNGSTSPTSQMTGQGTAPSSMLAQELKAIEKIKAKQKKEVEQMIEHELQLKKIKEKHEEKARQEQQKNARRETEQLRQKRMAEEKKEQDDAMRKQKAEQEAAVSKARLEELKRREQEAARKQKMQEIQRAQDKALKDEMRAMKLQQQEEESQRKQKESEAAAKARREELARRDQERQMYREEQNRSRQAMSLVKRLTKEKKIQMAKEQADATIAEQRALFQKREAHAEVVRQQFEYKRSLERQRVKEQAEYKSQQMAQIFKDSQDIEQSKKNKILESRAEADKRQAILAKEQERKLIKKKKQNVERQQYQVRVRVMMQKNQQDTVTGLLQKRDEKEDAQKKANQQKEFQQFIQKEMAMIKREDRLENVQRIARANACHQRKIMQKIELDKIKGLQLQEEKKNMLETRFAVRRQADRQKMQLMKTVEQMKNKGKFDKDELAKLGINVKSQNDNESAMNGSQLEDYEAEVVPSAKQRTKQHLNDINSAKQEINQVKQMNQVRQNQKQELHALISSEEQARQNRENDIERENDQIKRQLKEERHEQEIEQSQNKIQQMQEGHMHQIEQIQQNQGNSMQKDSEDVEDVDEDEEDNYDDDDE